MRVADFASFVRSLAPLLAPARRLLRRGGAVRRRAILRVIIWEQRSFLRRTRVEPLKKREKERKPIPRSYEREGCPARAHGCLRSLLVPREIPAPRRPRGRNCQTRTADGASTLRRLRSAACFRRRDARASRSPVTYAAADAYRAASASRSG